MKDVQEYMQYGSAESLNGADRRTNVEIHFSWASLGRVCSDEVRVEFVRVRSISVQSGSVWVRVVRICSG